MRYLLDTIVLIWAVRGLHDAEAVLDRLGSADLAVSVLELRRASPPWSTPPPQSASRTSK